MDTITKKETTIKISTDDSHGVKELYQYMSNTGSIYYLILKRGRKYSIGLTAEEIENLYKAFSVLKEQKL